MLPSGSLLNGNSSNIPQSTNDLISSKSTVIQNNEVQETSTQNPSIQNLAYVIDKDLQVRVSSVQTAFKEASSGAALSQITNVALDQQSQILSSVSDKLKYILTNETSNASNESIRKDIVELLDTFDKIAADSNYNELYTLQESNTSTNISNSHAFRISEVPPITLSTKEIQSNTDGLGLSDLKNLAQDGLTNTVANDQSSIVTDALEKIEQFQTDYKNLLSSFKTSTNSLSELHKSFEKSNENTKELNFKLESLIFDKSKILKEMSSYSAIQANALQSSVLNLLASNVSGVSDFNNINNTSKSSFSFSNSFEINK
jgi:flagellin-like hook-associated protein FlgL